MYHLYEDVTIELWTLMNYSECYSLYKIKMQYFNVNYYEPYLTRIDFKCHKKE